MLCSKTLVLSAGLEGEGPGLTRNGDLSSEWSRKVKWRRSWELWVDWRQQITDRCVTSRRAKEDWIRQSWRVMIRSQDNTVGNLNSRLTAPREWVRIGKSLGELGAWNYLKGIKSFRKSWQSKGNSEQWVIVRAGVRIRVRECASLGRKLLPSSQTLTVTL